MHAINLFVSGLSATADVLMAPTSGAVGLTVKLIFDRDWDGLRRRILFDGGGVIKTDVPEGDTYVIPFECLKSGAALRIGVDGWTDDMQQRTPTVWAYCGLVRPSVADVEGTAPGEPSPSEIQHLISIAGQAKEIAESVLQDAEAGKFSGSPGPAGANGADGHTPEYGVDYGTPEQIDGIVQQAASILQPGIEQLKNDLDNKVDFTATQNLTSSQQTQARKNIGIRKVTQAEYDSLTDTSGIYIIVED